MKTILASAAILASLVAAPAFAATPAKPLPTTITKQTTAKPAIKVSGKTVKHASLLRKHRVHHAAARKPAVKKAAPAVAKS